MRFAMFIVALALCAGVAYWAVSLRRPVTREGSGAMMGPSTGGMDPGTTLNNVRGAANRIEDDSVKRAQDIESKTAP